MSRKAVKIRPAPATVTRASHQRCALEVTILDATTLNHNHLAESEAIWQYIPFALCALVLSACDESSEAETVWSQMAKPFCALPVQVEMRCEAPWLPDLDQFHQGAQWPLNVPIGYRAEIAYGDSTTAIDEIEFEDASHVRFEAAGVTRVFARFSGPADCPATIVSREYRVSPAYPGGPDDPASEAINDAPIFVDGLQK